MWPSRTGAASNQPRCGAAGPEVADLRTTGRNYLSVLTVNIGAPSRGRARLLLDWLAGRPEEVLVITETSAGRVVAAQRRPDTGCAPRGRRPGEHIGPGARPTAPPGPRHRSSASTFERGTAPGAKILTGSLCIP
jgi:hypothetical protein